MHSGGEQGEVYAFSINTWKSMSYSNALSSDDRKKELRTAFLKISRSSLALRERGKAQPLPLVRNAG
jgi:hypothetical protein